MRRYNSLNSKDGEEFDITDSAGPIEDPEEETPFSEVGFNDGKTYKRTLCLVFTLFFGGLVRMPQ